MQTECPYCHTLFRITEAQLNMAEGKVRCGLCKQVFDARPSEDGKQAKTPGDEAAVQPTASTRTTELRDNAISPDYVLENESLFSDTVHDTAPDSLGRINGVERYSTTATVAWSLAIIVLMASLAAEYIWFNQPELLQHQQLKPLAAKLCELTNCDHLQKRAPSKIEMVSRNVYSHPNEKDALMVSTTLLNQAPFAQPFPDVQIDFSNIRGELVASRRFKPVEYLVAENGEEQQDLLQSGDSVALALEIMDPGKQAITYEFSFH